MKLLIIYRYSGEFHDIGTKIDSVAEILWENVSELNI